MDYKVILDNGKKRLAELWNLKIVKYTILIHFFYFFLSLILTLFVFRTQSDFYVYYRVGEIYVNDPNNLYNPAYYVDVWPFRYFPLSALLFVPYYLMGFNLGFIMFNLINLLLNIFISIILFKIILIIRRKDHEKENRRVILYICLYLISLPQVFNYVLGQINLYVTLLILLSLFIFLKFKEIKFQLLASIVLGISIIIKPTTIFMIPFIINLNYNFEKKRITFDIKLSFLRLFGVLLPLSLNIIMFLIYPDLLNGFLTTNFTGSETVLLNHSFSITKIISNMLLYIGFPSNELNVLPIFISVLLILGCLGLIIFIFRRFNKNYLIYGYTFGMLIMFLAYFDSWDHHLLNLTPLLIIMLFNLPRNSEITRKYIKPSFFFLSFLGLVFTGIFWLTDTFFPFNFASTIFLVLIYIGVSRYCLLKN
ncbi:MAG: DUF2029 domain-containing protein [Candidatus Lokiarchaeota archaeon]|nr:DUF2029 domain-containing protein [Candidatus Lokiarchaeota archaeon]